VEKNKFFSKIELLRSTAWVGLLLSTQLAIAAPPANDSPTNATVIPATFPLTYTDTLSTVEATRINEPPVSCGYAVGKTVWYSLTAPVDMIVNATADTFGSNFDTVLAAYTESDGNLTEIICNDDADYTLQSEISIGMSAGQQVYFMVGGWYGDGGDLIFTVNALAELTSPVNDDFDNATNIPVGAFPFQFTESLNTTLATYAGDDPGNCISSGGTVWYSFTSPVDTVVTASANTLGSDFDTKVAAYTGSGGNLSLIACNDDINYPEFPESEITIQVLAGEEVHFMVGGWAGATGDLVFKMTATDNPRITADCDFFRSVLRMDSLDDLRECKDGLDWQEIQGECYSHRLRFHASVWVAGHLCPDSTIGELVDSDLIFTWDDVDYSAEQAVMITETDVVPENDSGDDSDAVASFSASKNQVSAFDQCLQKYDAETCANKIAP